MSLDTVELIMSVEGEFEISISNELAAKITTPRELCEVVSLLRQNKDLPVDGEAIQTGIKALVFEISGITDKQYSLDGKFVEDFGLD